MALKEIHYQLLNTCLIIALVGKNVAVTSFMAVD